MLNIFILFFLLFSFNVFAQSEVTFAVHPDYAPVTFLNKQTNQVSGVAVDMLSEALKRMGKTPKPVRVMTWARAQEEVKLGRIDLLLPPYKTSEREKWMWFQDEPFLSDETAIFVEKK